MKWFVFKYQYIFSKESNIVFPQYLGLFNKLVSLVKYKHSVVVIGPLWEGRNNITSFADRLVKVGVREDTELIVSLSCIPILSRMCTFLLWV